MCPLQRVDPIYSAFSFGIGDSISLRRSLFASNMDSHSAVFAESF